MSPLSWPPKPTELPGILGELAALVGVRPALALAREYGGRRLFVPPEPKPGHRLCIIMGERAARVLGSLRGSERIDVPTAVTLLRWYAAARLRASGYSHGAIAEKLGMSERRVREITKGVEPSGSRRITRRRHGAAAGTRPAKPGDPRQLLLPLGKR